MHELHCSLKHAECILNVTASQPTPWPQQMKKMKIYCQLLECSTTTNL